MLTMKKAILFPIVAFALAMILLIALAEEAKATNNSQVCTGLDSGKIDTVGDPATVTITATPGYEITGYCVKAGSTQQGNGPVYVTVDPPRTSITISHPSGKDVSHYSWSESKIVVPPTTQPPETTVPPTTEPPVTTQPPVTTIPETTVATTVPPTTAPPSTEPPSSSTSVPPVTAPPPSVPPTTPGTPPVVVPVTELPATGGELHLAALAAAFLAAGTGITALARRPRHG